MVKLKTDILKIANKKLKSRLIVGTGKYKSFAETAKAIKASGADMVTVAVRRVNILDKKKPILTDYLNPKKIIYLPNTAGCYNSEEALRTLRLAREMGGWKLVKLEVLGDKKTLFPNMIETIKSTKVLTKEGFKVMVYCSDDPILSKKLEDNGAAAIMPLASPIRVASLPVAQWRPPALHSMPALAQTSVWSMTAMPLTNSLLPVQTMSRSITEPAP